MRGPGSAVYERAARGVLPTSDLRSARFRNDAVLKAVAAGRVRLGRPGDPSYPAPIRSSGTSVARVQQALVDLGYSLPRWGVDGRYGNETYQAVLLYKRNSGIRTARGHLDGIVGPLTITHLDRSVADRPLSHCYPGTIAAARTQAGRIPAQRALIPALTCRREQGLSISSETGGPTPDLGKGWRQCGTNWKICNGWVGFLYLDMILGRTRNVVCKFEVGVPNVNFRGRVSDSFATDAAEDAAGSAGLDLQRRLRAGDPLGAAPETVICKSFRGLMEAALEVVIPGAKVATVGTSRCP
jgi:hypothetical protein